jgi:hypothetical protein
MMRGLAFPNQISKKVGQELRCLLFRRLLAVVDSKESVARQGAMNRFLFLENVLQQIS